MQIKQTFKYKKDCKGSVVFEPTVDTAEKPGLCSAIYLNRKFLPNGSAVPSIEVTVDVPVQQNATTPVAS